MLEHLASCPCGSLSVGANHSGGLGGRSNAGTDSGGAFDCVSGRGRGRRRGACRRSGRLRRAGCRSSGLIALLRDSATAPLAYSTKLGVTAGASPMGLPSRLAVLESQELPGLLLGNAGGTHLRLQTVALDPVVLLRGLGRVVLPGLAG